MSKGFLVLAQNNNETDYVKQAYLLARSLQVSQPLINNISLVTNDQVPNEYKSAFDKIIEIPFGDQASNSTWKVENRWKLYHATPYDETIVFDADMLVTSDLTKCWDFANNYELFFTSRVTDYRGNTIIDKIYRKTFIENNLPNLYTGMFYFKKTDKVLEFFKLVEYIFYNWERFFFEITPNSSQKFFSMDVAVSIAVKLLDIVEEVTHTQTPFTFVHMKPAIQGWVPTPNSSYSQVTAHYNKNNELYVGNYKQLGVFHYVEDSFVTDDLEENLRGKV